jgi:hypothetical protein
MRMTMKEALVAATTNAADTALLISLLVGWCLAEAAASAWL